MVRAVNAPLLLLLGTMLAFSGCISTSPNEPEIAIEVHSEDTTIIVDGRTDLEDGTQLQYDVWLGDRPYSEQDGYFAHGLVSVSGNRFSFSTDTRGWPPGTADVAVAFDSNPFQPAAVVSRYGEGGELLLGPHVENDSDGPVVIVRHRTQINGR